MIFVSVDDAAISKDSITIIISFHHCLAVVSSNFLFGHYYQSVIGNTSKI